MKKIFLLVVSTTFFSTVYANDAPLVLYNPSQKGISIQLKKYRGSYVSSECIGKKCMALSALSDAKSKPKLEVFPSGRIKHPAHYFCLRVGGTPIVLHDKGLNEYNYCKLKDSSFIDSWALYNKASTSKTSK